jgi:3-deoxy-D-manno-octulosonic-acid transferase
MKLFIYNSIVLLLLPFFLVRILFKSIQDKDYVSSFHHRLGFYKQNKTQNSIWFHAVSLGEVIASEKIIKKLLESNDIVLSVTTPTGLRQAKKIYKDKISIIYAPWDFWFFISGVFRSYNPKALIIFETEIWPSMISYSRNKNIPVILCNGRLSDNSLKNYMIFKNFFKKILNKFELIFAQTNNHKENFKSLIGSDEIIEICGSVKFDIDTKEEPQNHVSNYSFFLASSTHPGEDEIILNAFTKLKESFGDLKLIIVPRHPERANSIKSLFSNQNVKAKILSDTDQINGEDEIVIFNAIGHLNKLYSIANLAFVGGSMFKETGGHNIIEPAANMCPFIFGPYIYNFEDISQMFLSENACIQISNEDELYTAAKKILSSSEFSSQLVSNAISVVKSNKGSVDKQSSAIIQILNSRN